jgi:hypothetical protein
MKGYKSVIATRMEYHRDGTKNSVHRASLLAPEIPGTDLYITFANHFLIKRNIENVACRITGIDETGQRIEARLVEIDKPCVYSFCPSDIISTKAAAYQIDFFAAANLYYPFPAVMVNHIGRNFLNTVHAYNRVLNDVFEDDDINTHTAWESAVDVTLDKGVDTKVLLAAGQQACRGDMELELVFGGRAHFQRIETDVPRLGHQTLSVREIFPDVTEPVDGYLRMLQPHQPFFYGRLLAGRWRQDGAFSANHSYYDSSETEEYWDNDRPHQRTFPWFDGWETGIRIYPIMSPSQLRFWVTFQDSNGRVMGTAEIGSVTSPSHDFLSIWLDKLVAAAGIDTADISAFTLHAQSTVKKTPTRITHQVLYRPRGKDALPASINVSLADPNTPVPKDATGLTWCQAIVGDGIESQAGIQHLMLNDIGDSVDVTFFDDQGELARRSWSLAPGAALTIDIARELENELAQRGGDGLRFVWMFVHSSRKGISTFTVARTADGGACAAEHGF